MMQHQKYRVTFLTPAFLGNAEQSGQWRTPPFKALLRQWWRVVWATHNEFPEDIAAMRRDEGRLFGNAWLKDDFRKSDMRMRLSKWTTGSLTKSQWGRQDLDGKIRHPEVGQPVGPLLYLGYGPLEAEKLSKPGGHNEYATVLKKNATIQVRDAADLSIAVPESDVTDVRDALTLMNAYGTIGGRSRNGWGSFRVEPLDASGQSDGVRKFARPWQDALTLDWPHAIGADDTGLLVWHTSASYDDWKLLMRQLAILKIGLRTMFVFPDAGPPHGRPQKRHWLSYPITRHGTSQWNRNVRLPNSLRFKVRPDPDDQKRLRGVIFHVPCRPPAEFGPDDRAIACVWKITHQLLDELTHPAAQRRYAMIDDNERGTKLRESLDTLTLERSPE